MVNYFLDKKCDGPFAETLSDSLPRGIRIGCDLELESDGAAGSLVISDGGKQKQKQKLAENRAWGERENSLTILEKEEI